MSALRTAAEDALGRVLGQVGRPREASVGTAAQAEKDLAEAAHFLAMVLADLRGDEREPCDIAEEE